ncbi:hypothetical protein [Roseococcus sp. YIM B11640]|uniref:hypothetical protein n=1 Tax=Roseococcus sp. YIM B11640 TaxID=3133973 RepID=UPI003C7EC28C
MRRAGWVIASWLLAAPVSAQERVGVRTGDHPGFGRIVFDWTAPPRYEAQQQGERVLLRFPRAEAVDLAGARRLPRNVIAVNRAEGGLELVLRPGTRMRHFRNGPKVALDLMDPAEGSAVPAPAAPPPQRQVQRPEPLPLPLPAPPSPEIIVAAPPQALVTVPAEPPRVIVADLPRLQPVAAPQPVAAEVPPATSAAPVAERVSGPRPLLAPAPAAPPPVPVAASLALPEPVGPLPLRPRITELPGQGPVLRFALPIGAGVAVLRRGDLALLVIETDRRIEFGPIARHPDFVGIEARSVPSAAIITWPLREGRALSLRRDDGEWLLTAEAPRGGGTPVRLEFEAERAALLLARPSRVVTLEDPLSGLPLMVGTVSGGDARQAVSRGLAEFDLLETFLGVAVLARADHLGLRSAPDRFWVGIEGGTVAVADAALATAPILSSMSRSFDFPSLPVAALLERLRAQQAEIAAAAPQLRSGARLAAAQSLLALGLPQEAQAMLRLALQENPRAARDPRLDVLNGMAGLLAGRTVEGRGLDAGLPASDELRLWHAARAAMRGEPAVAAPGFIATLPLLLAYPEGLRRRLLPAAAEALAEGGEAAAARRLMDGTRDDPAFALAQALVAEAEGNPARAIELYEAAASGRDRLMRARALRRATELKLASGRLDASGAARELEQTLFAWRGGAPEIDARERIAALRREAGEARSALALLRETEALFPERAPALRGPIQDAFLASLRSEPPLGAAALYDAHPDLLPEGRAGEEALIVVSEGLAGLDLVDRASALLGRAMERLAPGAMRAGLGARLAELRLGERDAEGALSALAASSAPRLPLPLVERRSLLAARAEARRGHRELAAEALRAMGPAGDQALAELLLEERNYAGAASVLARHLAASVPAEGELADAQQRSAVSLAAILAMAGDEAGLAAHRARYGSRITVPALARGFDALSADPVRGLADLPRLARELELFRAAPQVLEPLRTVSRGAG